MSHEVPQTKQSKASVGFRILSFLILLNSVRLVYQPGPLGNMMGQRLGGRSNFLTLWALAFSFLTSVINMLHGFYPTKLVLRDLRVVLMAISLPLDTAIGAFYWSVVLTKPELMIPADMGDHVAQILPLSSDLALHLYPAILMWLEYIFFSSTLANPRTRAIHLTNGATVRPFSVLVGFALSYTTWMELMTACGGTKTFPYPFLEAQAPVRVMIYLAGLLFTAALFKISESIHPFMSPSLKPLSSEHPAA